VTRYTAVVSLERKHNLHISGARSGRPMLFAHGYGCDQTMWRFITPAFEADHPIVLFDHVGAGKSDLAAYDRERYSRLDGYADDVLKICSELDLHDVIFVGHSVSSMIGVLAAVRDPKRFAALVLVAPSPCYINEGDYRGGFSRGDIEGLLDTLDANYLGWAQAMTPVIMGRPDRPELVDELTNSFCRTEPEIAKHFAHVTFSADNRADLPKVRVRSLILQVTQDAIAPVSVGEYMQRTMPNSQLAMIETTGHCPHLSAPELTIGAIEAFLSRM
jgi:sigma-B regulation protein RsbQ